LRYFFLGAHYRGPVNFDLERLADGRIVFPGLDEAERRIEYIYATREALIVAAAGTQPSAGGDGARAATVREAPERVLSALDNDLNTAVALRIVGEVARVGNELVQQVAKRKHDPHQRNAGQALAAATVAALDRCCGPLGLMQATPQDFFARTRARRLKLRGLDGGAIEAKVLERTRARAARDFARADAIRAELEQMGVELQDVPGDDRTVWKVSI
jgi:cysteinyl-tRNA synthetase